MNFRVEIDRASLADAVSSAREALGQGLTSAVQGVQGAADRAASTTSVAMASAQGHLGFLGETRQRLTTQNAPASDASATMTLMRAAAVRSGLVDAGFSQTRDSLERAAKSAFSGFSVTAEERALAATGGLASIVGLSSTAASIAGALGVGGAAALSGPLFVGQLALEGVYHGWERSVDRRKMQRMLGRYGLDSAVQMTRGFEDDVNAMAGVSFGEASMVARSAIANIGPENLTRDQARRALTDAIGDWQAAGKLLGVTREQALEETGHLYRLGIRPGEDVRRMFASTAGAAASTGFDAAALNRAGSTFAEGSASVGYGIAGSHMQFTMQVGMIGEALRAGSMSRAMLTAAAGFSGPISNQATAAAENFLTEMRAVSDTAPGRMMTAGLLAGGSGDMQSLASAAAGMSMQQRIEFEAKRLSVDPLKIAGAAGSTFENQLRGMGLNVTEDALAGMFSSRLGMSMSQSKIAAHAQMHPEEAARTAYRTRSLAQSAYDANSMPTVGIARGMAELGSGLGDAWDALAKERSEWAGLAFMGMPALVTAPMRQLTGHDYRGFRGIGRAFKDVGTGFGGLIDKAWNNWSVSNRLDSPTWSFWSSDFYRYSYFDDKIASEVLTAEDVDDAGPRGLAAEMDSLSDLQSEARSGYGLKGPQGAAKVANIRRADAMSRYKASDTFTFNNRIAGVMQKLGDAHIDVSTAQAESLFEQLAPGALAKRRGGDMEKEKARLVQRVMMRGDMEGISKAQASRVVDEFLNSDVYGNVASSTLEEVSKASKDSRFAEGLSQIMSDADTREKVAQRLFAKGSAAQKRFIEMSAAASPAEFESLMQKAVITGQNSGRMSVEEMRREAFKVASVDMKSKAEATEERTRAEEDAKAQAKKGELQNAADMVIAQRETNMLLRQFLDRMERK